MAANDRIDALDGLRAVAAFLVFLFHAHFLRGGFIGVDLFFVLSGFVITRMIFAELERGHFSIGRFYRNRLVRLVPALVAVLCFALLYRSGEWEGEVIPALVPVANWTRAFSDFPRLLGHTWSLAVEWQFYLVWPLVVLFLAPIMATRAGASAALVAALALLVACWRAFLFFDGASVARLYNGTDTHADGLLLGCALAISGATVARRIAPAWPVAIACIVILALCGNWRAPWFDVVGFALVAVCGAVVIAELLQDGVLARLLSRSFLVRGGAISYAFYLWHYPILRSLGVEMRAPKIVIALVCFTITLVAAELSWWLIESPILRASRGARLPMPEMAPPVR